MSNASSIQAGLPTSVSGYSVTSPRSSTPVTTSTPKPVALFVNPSYRFDPTVGLEVIEFHDNSGTVSNTIPSARQLQAYRDHQATPPGEQASQTPSTPPTPQLAHGKTAAG
jgi:hypothetical protein